MANQPLAATPPPATASARPVLRVLLVEDSPSDHEIVRDLLTADDRLEFALAHATRLDEALALMRETAFDAVLLDLGLPDSQGVDTFARLHAAAPEVPILVLTASDDAETGASTIRGGAEEYLLKQQAQSTLLSNAVRYTVLRAGVRHERALQVQREERTREMQDMDRLTQAPATTVSARVYSGSPLRENGPGEFNAAVAEYGDLVSAALDRRIHGGEGGGSERLRELGLQIGFMRGGPRDVVEIHTTALRRLTTDTTATKARALMEEGRLMLLELMGNLTSYYRSYYTATTKLGPKI